MRAAIATAAAALVAAASSRAGAATDDDANLVPQTVIEQPAAAPGHSEDHGQPAPARSAIRSKVFLEEAFSIWSRPAAVPVAYPPSRTIDWQNRSSFDVALQWKPWRALAFTLSDRVNVFEQDGQSLLSADTVRNDLREASVTWELAPSTYLEGGRINVRNGTALGYNPTDFLKTRTLVGQASLDPSVIRQNRLGTLMARAQTIWSRGSASVAYAPKVADPSPLVETDPVGVDPRLDATNAAHRVLCTLNLDLLDLSPQLLAYFEQHRSKIGANVSRTLGDAVVAYAEWAGGPEQGLVARAVAFGQDTRTLPPGAPLLPPASANTVFRNDLAAGFSWTLGAAVTLNLEYHFHDGAFTRTDWRNWFDLGAEARAAAELWFVRGVASDQQEPVTQHQAFVRVAWPRAIGTDLELGAFAFVDLLDASVLTQVSASYYASEAWTLSAYVAANLGDGRTERGSFPQRINGILQVTRYL